MSNGQKISEQGFSIEAIPMYNVPETADAFHTKGRGNGYVIEKGGKRIYISGDSGRTQEMMDLKNIDWAFIAMNLPYTMSEEDAASAVVNFKPKKVSPYHYKGSDLNKFKELISQTDPNIEVGLIKFYLGQ